METPAHSVSLNVIALISGGKDSMFSMLHCLANGHKVVALANLYPSRGEPGASDMRRTSITDDAPWDEDVDSYMYQTAGHNLVPLYADALGLPLYRQEIIGDVQDPSKSYSASGRLHDETEALVPLLNKVLRYHPAANAVSSGAILSTYQRTRIESVAVRLGLVSLSYLWQYPLLPRPQQSALRQSPSALLQDMAEAGFDCRIIKVATGGLDDSLLWSDLISRHIRDKVERAVNRFGGSVLGEGGEYETMVIKGPANIVIIKAVDSRTYNHRKDAVEPKRILNIWRGRIYIAETDMRRATEGGLAFKAGRGHVVPVEDAMAEGTITIPNIWDVEFEKVLGEMRKHYSMDVDTPMRKAADQAFQRETSLLFNELNTEDKTASDQSKRISNPIRVCKSRIGNILTVSNLTAWEHGHTPHAQMLGVNEQLFSALNAINRPTSSIIFTTIILRSMSDFPVINHAYGQLFTAPNPPARVTVACALPPGIDIMVSVVVSMDDNVDALHVQSRSYWAPANIGPYSQAVSVPSNINERPSFVYVAGQIPLIPSTMETIESPGFPAYQAHRSLWVLDGFQSKCCLALQHLWRIGREMKIDWWTGAIAFIVGGDETYTRVSTAWAAWRETHALELWEEPQAEDDDNFDVWESAYGQHSSNICAYGDVHRLPNFGKLTFEYDKQRPLPYDGNNMTYSQSQDFESPRVPGFFAVEVDGLPRSSEIEWQGLGIAQSEVKLTTHSIHKFGHCPFQIRSCSIALLRRFVSYIEIPFVPSLEQGIRRREISVGVDWVRNVAAPGNDLHITIYTSDVPLVMDIDAQIVPCHTVWGPGGKRLTAGIVANFTIRDGMNLQTLNS